MTPRAYRSAFSLSLGTAIPAALLTGLADTLLTVLDAADLASGDGPELVLRGLGLYALLAVISGVLEGTVLGAVWATHPGASPRRLWRRLVDDREIDRRVAAWGLAGVGAAALFALLAA
jgi:hypothetical protein